MAKKTVQTKSKTDQTSKSTSKFALTKDNLFDKYTEAETYTNILNQPFDEFQRIARNKPYPGLAKKYPRVAEGSTSAYISQKPRQLIQQTPTGDVRTEDNQEWLQLVAQWALDNEIVPNATEDYPVFEKAQNGMEQALSVGFTCTTAPFYNHNGIWSPDMSMCFWGDVLIPGGYKSIKAMPYTFLRGWWPPEQVDAILADPAAAKAGGWDTQNLSETKENLSTKDVKAETPVEKERGLPENYVKVVVGYQKGIKAPIFTFDPDNKKILRTKPNPDPRGHKNIQVMYGLIDGTNPFGVSVVELVGAWQNLMDNDVQAYQYNRAYSVDPALIRHGNIGDGELYPGASFTAQSTDDGIEPITIDTNALDNFPTIHEWQRATLYGLLNAPTNANSAEAEAPLGKTPKGIAQAANLISTDDLTYINHVHEWFQEWAETALNIYFAERKGKQVLELDQQTADQLRSLGEEGKFDISLLDAVTNKLVFDFDQKLPIFRFKVDGSSSKLQDESAQLQALDGLLSTISGNPMLEQLVGQEKIAQIYNKMVALSGIHDSTDLELDIKAIKQQEEEQQSQQESENKAMAEQAKAPTVAIAFKDLPGYGQLQAAIQRNIQLRPQDVGLQSDLSPQPTDPNAVQEVHKKGVQPTPTDVASPPNPQVPKEMIQAVTTLQQAGLPEILIPHAIQALTEGVPLEDIIQSINNPSIAKLKQLPGAKNG